MLQLSEPKTWRISEDTFQELVNHVDAYTLQGCQQASKENTTRPVSSKTLSKLAI